MIDLSPGLAQSGFELLQLIGRHGLTMEDMLGGLERVGAMPTREVLALTQSLDWIQVGEDGRLVSTAAGARLLDAGTYAAMLRLTLLDHAGLSAPPWLQNARMGRVRVLSFAPVGVRQILVEAGVAEGTDDMVVAFWDQLAALARGQRDERLNAIGRLGERLTLDHELSRTGMPARWAAIDSNADGFDILSIVGVDDSRQLAIEAKATTMGMAGEINLTRHEWNTATSVTAYRFDIWDLSKRTAPRLACIGVEAMAQHVPTDQGAGQWAQVTVPVAVFQDQFRSA